MFEGWDVSAERRVERAVVSAIFPAKSVDFRKFLAALRALRFPAAFPEILTQPNTLLLCVAVREGRVGPKAVELGRQPLHVPAACQAPAACSATADDKDVRVFRYTGSGSAHID